MTAQSAALQLGLAAAGSNGVDVPAVVEAEGALGAGGPAGGVDEGGGRGSGGRRKAAVDVEAPLVAAAEGGGDVRAVKDCGVRKVTRGRGHR